MEGIKFNELKKEVQEIIDLIASGQTDEANYKLADANELLDELLDHLEQDKDLIEITRYQVLLNQLRQKIN